ncbi:non-ribosomal peptide synthetase [Streptomyces cacaoi]|uniref:non-ribosomal peptide synthetase n=1 Tax=Streptomyces cacaoi TaxID=1898 RepID=UPI0026354648|nr:non-ribosomal peptide synthetase [Streptomyces cacaoi]
MTPAQDAATAPVGPSRTPVDGFTEWAARTPEAPAVVCGPRSLSYRQLDRAAGRLAHRLRAAGAGPETLVGIALRRSVTQSVAVLGVLKAGAACLPVDPDQPLERTRALLADAGVRLVVTEKSVQDTLPEDGWGPGVDALPAETGMADTPADSGPGTADGATGPEAPAGTTAGPDAGPAPGSGPHNLMYVLYTSGSTGRPKGIAMHAGPQITLLDWCRDRYAERPVALQFFPLNSDVGFLELLSTWWLGGCAVVATEHQRHHIPALAEVVDRHRVDKVLLPVLALDRLAAHAAEHPGSCGTLRELITTGDQQVVTPAVRALCDRLPGVLLDNHYGSTELNVVTAPRLTAPVQEWPERPPVGRPVVDARIYVLDAGLRPVPPGVPGEIYVGGGPPARGYLGDPAQTARAFLPDPYTKAPGSRMYRTGDRGRWRTDGVLEYLGRADFQIKLHGYRIEPGEIESLLRAREDISQAVVLKTGEGEEAMLAAYTASAGGTPPQADELRDHLARLLPPYMVPQAYVPLPELPLTSTGKVDRKRLPAVDTARPRFLAPRDEDEAAIAGVFCDVLGKEKVGVEDSFFRLGGHSLLITQLVHRLRTACGVQLPLRAVFERATPAQLAEEVRAVRAARAGDGAGEGRA